MQYFAQFPKLYYSLDNALSASPIVVTNILARAKLLRIIKNNSLVYYTYMVKDGETPEIIAHKYYKDPNRHWIIMYANNIIDPLYDWPMQYDVFNKFLAAKYGSIANAQSTIHHYNKIITKTDSDTTLSTVRKYKVDANTYNTISHSVSTVNLNNGKTVTIDTNSETIYCDVYENDLNEAKRQIKIIDKAYVTQIENELLNLMAV